MAVHLKNVISLFTEQKLATHNQYRSAQVNYYQPKEKKQTESLKIWRSIAKEKGWFHLILCRQLNSVTKEDNYPLPRINDNKDMSADSKLLSTLDLKSGYWQVELDSEDKQKTSFSVGSG